jgi:hypothetical protein
MSRRVSGDWQAQYGHPFFEKVNRLPCHQQSKVEAFVNQKIAAH